MFLTKIYDNWFFNASSGERSALQIISWWEIRRIPFNILIGTIGIISLILLFKFVGESETAHPGEDIVEPISLLLTPIAINFCYTFGWIGEIAFSRIWKVDDPKLGTKLLRTGTGITLVFILLPTLIWGIIFTLVKLGLSDKFK